MKTDFPERTIQILILMLANVEDTFYLTDEEKESFEHVTIALKDLIDDLKGVK
jgi:hypothetical protein